MRVCVYCGSGKGKNPFYADAARVLGQALAEAQIGLVYGGGGLGLMGALASSVLSHGGEVTGIIPHFLSKQEFMLDDVQELIVTNNMHERKQLMFEYSDAFVALPGGVGTLEELVEQLTWAQLGHHEKPIVLANIMQFWDPFIGLVEHMREQAFVRPGIEVRYKIVDSAHNIVPTILTALSGKHEGETDPEIGKHF